MMCRLFDYQMQKQLSVYSHICTVVLLPGYQISPILYNLGPFFHLLTFHGGRHVDSGGFLIIGLDVAKYYIHTQYQINMLTHTCLQQPKRTYGHAVKLAYMKQHSQQQNVSSIVEIMQQNQSFGRRDTYSNSRRYKHHKIGDITTCDLCLNQFC